MRYINNIYEVRFQVLTATRMKKTVLWDIALCSPVEVDRCFRGAYLLPSTGRRWCLHHVFQRDYI